MREFLKRFFRVILELFYRRIEVVGLENIPREGKVIFAVNHPNGLVDPIFVLSYAPRSVSFLAKAPLFRYPLIGWFTRKLDSIPVYRKQDATPGSNRETFSRSREVLARGGGIAIFPEGTTHSDSRMRELKTGAARIALGSGRAGESVLIVPTGIYYTAKQTFRSEALVVFGEPLSVAAEEVDEAGEPPAESVRGVTRRIEEGLDAITLQADSHAALDLIARAERIFSAGSQELASELELRKQFVEGYHFLSARDPKRVDALASRITRFEAELKAAGLDPETLSSRRRVPLRTLLLVIVLLPIAMVGGVIHYPAYALIRILVRRFSKGESEMMATMKFVGSLIFYPLTWLAIAFAVSRAVIHRVAHPVIDALPAFFATMIVVPLLGYCALRIFEMLDEVIGSARALVRRGERERLKRERSAIREEIIAVANEMEGGRPAR